MGIIRKQTVSGSIFSYLGVILGFVNLAILSPKVFSAEQIGLPALIIAISVIVSQLGSLGFNSVTIRLFPYFRNVENSNNGFLGLNFIIQTAGLFLVIVGMIIFIPGLIERNSEDLALLKKFAYLIIPVLIFQLYFVLFDSYCRVLMNATLGILLKEFVVRMVNLVLIILFWTEVINFSWFMYLFVLAYGLPTVGLIIYLLSRKELRLKIDLGKINSSFRKEIIAVSLFGIVAGLSGIAVANIDRFMINEILDLSAVGVYAIAFAFGTLILIPGRAMAKIAAPIIAEYWKAENSSGIKDIYKKSSINQFLGGLILLLLIWISVDDIFILLDEKYAAGQYVVLFIALANLITAISGVSLQILSTSSSFRYHTWFMILLILLVIISNWIFIPLWGISGAALATLLSTLIYVVARVLFVYLKYRMHPFGLAHLVSVIIFIMIYLLLGLINFEFHPLVNIIIRSALAGPIFLALVYILRCSPDFNDTIKELTGSYRKRDRS